MKKIEKNIITDRKGIDDASDTVRKWLEEAGMGNRDILRIRMITEEILINICSFCFSIRQIYAFFLKKDNGAARTVFRNLLEKKPIFVRPN